LYDFDISPDLSLHPSPVSNEMGGMGAFELSLSYRF
jgi:hypothetical protein